MQLYLYSFRQVTLYLVLTLLFLLQLVSTTTVPSQDQKLIETEQTEYILELRQTILSFLPSPESLNAHHVTKIKNEKISLLKRLRRPLLGQKYPSSHPRYRLLSAIDGFRRYGERAEAGIQRKRELFHWVKSEQKSVYNPFPFFAIGHLQTYCQNVTYQPIVHKQNITLR